MIGRREERGKRGREEGGGEEWKEARVLAYSCQYRPIRNRFRGHLWQTFLHVAFQGIIWHVCLLLFLLFL